MLNFIIDLIKSSYTNIFFFLEIKTLFSVFDKNKDGFLTAKEVAALLQSGKLSVSIPYNAVQKIVRGVDQKGKPHAVSTNRTTRSRK